jgi:hypothetical protein
MPIRPTVAAAAPSNRSAAGRRIRFTSREYSAESRATGYRRREHETIKEAITVIADIPSRELYVEARIRLRGQAEQPSLTKPLLRVRA